MAHDLLPRLFVRDWRNTSDPAVRARYGKLTGIVGILVNLVLFAGKYAVGMLSGSVAICADAVNNLSDAASSVVSLIAFHISAKPADRSHPYGHARIEYVASMLVSFVILYIGIDLLRDSVDKILHPTTTTPSLATIIVLILSILGKLWLFLFNRNMGKRIGSAVMEATAADSLSDVLATSAVLVSTLILHFAAIDLDGYIGIAVALVICVAGLRLMNETKNYILGTGADPELTEKIRALVLRYPEVLGMHDLMVHSYGPGQYFATLHVEVDGSADIFHSHDVVDNIENALRSELALHASIHMDPLVVNDPLIDGTRLAVASLLEEIDARLSLHDFRMVPGDTHTNLIFDVAVPFEFKMEGDDLCDLIATRVKTIDEHYVAVVSIDLQ